MKSAICACLLSGISCLGFPVPLAVAQVTEDNTLSTQVTSPDNLHFLIHQGDRAGNNLFHSFAEFSIPAGGSASFNNAVDITNIFSRVTGGTISNIQGMIRANGAANLFLLNPAGILFGENAALSLGGSFFATTAKSVVFSDGVEFSAVEPNAIPLLTMNVPIGLQIGSGSGRITVRGEGHHLSAADPVFSPYLRSPTNSGLQVPPGNTLAFIGGDILLEGGILTAESGRIDLLANQPTTSSLVNLMSVSEGWQIIPVDGGQLGDITLRQAALLDASGMGSIQLQGNNISLSDGSLALIQNTTSAPAGTISIRASASLSLTGLSPNGQIRSGLENQTLATGNGGDIRVFASDVTLTGGAAIFTRSFDSGASGDIAVNTSGLVQVLGFSVLDPGSNANTNIATLAFGDGHSGDFQLTASQLTLLDAGNIGTTTFGEGDAGQLMVNIGGSIEIGGFNPVTGSISAIGSTSFGAGDAGNSIINTGQLAIFNQARITSGGFAFGEAGSVVVNASESIDVSGDRSSIDSSVDILPEVVREIFRLPDIPNGNAGSVMVYTPVLRVTDGAQISVRNEGTGAAGALRINANSVALDRQSGITASTGTGTGGDIDVKAQTLRLSNGSQINASTQAGQGGNIDLKIAGQFQLSNQAQIIADALQAGQGGNINIIASETRLMAGGLISTNVQGTAAGGSLSLRSDRLSVLGGASITAITVGAGQAGNLLVEANDIEISGGQEINAPFLGLLPSPSVIGAGTFPGSTGQGGNLTVRGDRIRITDGGLITVGTSGAGASGDIDLVANERLDVSGVGNFPAPFFGFFNNHPSRISASSITDAPAGSASIQALTLSVTDGAIVEVNGAGIGGAGNLSITSDRILLNNNASLQAEVAGGDRGNITLNTSDLRLNNGSFISTSATNNANGGNINIDSNLILLENQSEISANASQQANGGNITIKTDFLVAADNSQIAANAELGQGGNIFITAEGIFLSPDSSITASSELGIDGNVTIARPNVDVRAGFANLPENVSDPSQQVATDCTPYANSRFVVTGRGGVPSNPQDPLQGDRPWADTRNLATFRNQPTPDRPAILQAQQLPLVEVTSWVKHPNGQLTLVSTNPSPSAQRFSPETCSPIS